MPDVDQGPESPGEVVHLHTEGAVARIVLATPERRNALTPRALDDIERHLDRIEDDPTIRVVVLEGEGDAFCAGADLDAVDELRGTRRDFGQFLDRWHQVFTALERCTRPTIAAVQGLALAGGFELLLVVDLVVAAAGARIGDQHARYGLFPAGGSSQRLPRLVGQRRATWLLLTGEWLTADEALQWGLVNEVVPPDQLAVRVSELAQQLAARSPLAAARVKRAVRLGLDTDLVTALAWERDLALDHQVGSLDAQIGIQAFRDREEPIFPDPS